MTFRNKWLMCVLLSAGLAMDYQARVEINSVFPLLRRDLGMTDVQVGFSAAAFLWTYGLLSPVAGYLGDCFRRRTVLLTSVVFWNLLTILCGFTVSAWQLVLMRAVLAFAQVVYVPTAQALITDVHGNQTQGKAIGIFQAGCYIGIFLAGLPAAYVATHLGWRAMFWISGLIGLLCAGLMLGLPGDDLAKRIAHREVETVHRTSVASALSLLRKPSIAAIMAAFALCSGANWIVFTFLPLFIYERYHFSLESAAFQGTVYMQAAGTLADPVLGHVADAWSARSAKNRFYFCALAGCAGLPALAGVGLGGSPTVLVLGLVLFGIASAGADVSWMPMLSYVTSKYQRATAFGYLNMAACLAGGLSAMIAALTMKNGGLAVSFAAGGLLFFLLALVLVAGANWWLERDMARQTSVVSRKCVNKAW